MAVSAPSIQEILKAIATKEFWIGGFFVGSIILLMGVVYYNVQTELDKKNLELANKNLEMHRIQFESENKYLSRELKSYKEDLGAIKSDYLELVEEQKKWYSVISNRCYQQRKYIRALQLDHKFQMKYAADFEYLSILEKVLIYMAEQAENC